MKKETMATNYEEFMETVPEGKKARFESDVLSNDVPINTPFTIEGAVWHESIVDGNDFSHGRLILSIDGKDAGTTSFTSIIGNVTDVDENGLFVPVEGKKKPGKFYPKSGKKFNNGITAKNIFNYFGQKLIASEIEYTSPKVFEHESKEALQNAEKTTRVGYKINVL